MAQLEITEENTLLPRTLQFLLHDTPKAKNTHTYTHFGYKMQYNAIDFTVRNKLQINP